VTVPDRAHAESIGFEQSPDFQVVTHGPDLRVLAANVGVRRLLGDHDPAGKTMSEALGQVLGDPVIELFREVFETGQTHHLDGWRVHTGHQDAWISADLTIAPWRDEGGNVAGCIGRGTDLAALAPTREAAETRYSATLELMTDLQDALLPSDLPVAPALDVSATYLLAADDARAGGDWFDAIVRTDGTFALVVGDTVGQGIKASAVMGQLRAVLHERLLAGDPIPEALRSLDRYARLHPESHAATVCVVVVDPASGAVEYCTAGHPAPLVVAADGSSRYLQVSGSGPLTTESDYFTRHDTLGTDDVVLLFTDGLTERPGVSPAQSEADIAQAATWAAVSGSQSAAPAERRSSRVCERTLDRLIQSAGYNDDITLLAAHRTPTFGPIRISVDRSPDAVRSARDRLDEWLGTLQVAVLDEFAVLHAAGELVTNAIEHAYPEGATPDVAVELVATLEPDGVLDLTVADHGCWNDQPPHPDRGRGLGMVSGLVDLLTIDRTDAGSTARFRKRLTRSAQLLTGSSPGAYAATAGEVPFGTEVKGDMMKVRGPVDLKSADNFRASLRRFSRGGTAELTVDLAGVTHLGSAGVQVLHEINAMDGASLHLRAPSGSVAQHVLELVRLPYDEAPTLSEE
jgi:serine phosphatase RsbU (regulator of sigma subunit)/anti-sigma regulatory factor (Ser/Thr protein kinase)/anti-anti-sigma regulatory factor